ncbi:MAG: 16S rRNA (adenine(1518)-N(6)/adenine(1519)-N(6))-dimethyltransferase RsmA [Desulfohalobiaceae bacterium]|nr:16S rRNA (adenine(1518)-N(6)/adenine(1519)-N(6))-dimethyltransferase RsmA [Desulfohalobiaceae bacterium]
MLRKDAVRPPKKSLGQNFLTDPNTARKIASCLSAGPGQKVLEIGPGYGSLTTHLMKQTARLFVLEKDPHLAWLLKSAYSSLNVICGDGLLFDWTRLRGDGYWKIIGNLPYNIASPLIWNLLARTGHCSRMVFMVQKEVAQRIRAEPGSRDYGAISVWVQNFARVSLEFFVGTRVFHPRPRVDSAVISLTPFHPEKRPKEVEKLAQLLRLCFQKRRKQMSTILRPHWSGSLEKWFEKQHLTPKVRPESLSPGQFRALSRIIF